MCATPVQPRWAAVLEPHVVPPLSVLLGGVLLHSMNVLITATLLPSIVSEIGGAGLMSWPTTAFVAASIVAAAGTGIIGGASGPAGRLPAEPALMPAARSPTRWRRRSVL